MRASRGAPAQRGFSIIELFLVLFIIGVLASMSAPGFLGMGARARRAEAHEALGTVARLQAGALAEKGRYAGALLELNFGLEGAKTNADGSISTRRYTYSCAQPGGSQSFLCTAAGNIDSDPFLDVVAVGASAAIPVSTVVLYDDSDNRVNDAGPLAPLVAP